jgi:hypothetical protein
MVQNSLQHFATEVYVRMKCKCTAKFVLRQRKKNLNFLYSVPCLISSEFPVQFPQYVLHNLLSEFPQDVLGVIVHIIKMLLSMNITISSQHLVCSMSICCLYCPANIYIVPVKIICTHISCTHTDIFFCQVLIHLFMLKSYQSPCFISQQLHTHVQR